MIHFFKRPFLTLLFSMALVAFLPLLLNSIFYIQFRDTILQQQKNLTEESLQLSAQQIDRTLLELTTLSMRLGEEMQGLSIPDEDTLDSAGRLELRSISDNLRQELQKASEYVSDIYLYSVHSETAVKSTGVNSRKLLYQIEYKPLGISISDMDKLHNHVSYADLVSLTDSDMAFTRTIRQNPEGQPELQLVFLLKHSFYTTLIDKGNVENGLFLLARQGEILAVSNKTGMDLSEEELKRAALFSDTGDFQLGEETAMLYTQSTAGGYQVKAVVPYTGLLESSQNMQTTYFLLLAASVGLGLALAVLLSCRNMMPVNQLIRYIRRNYASEGTGSSGLEQIKDAVDSLLAQRRTDQEQLQEYESQIGRNRLLEMLRGNRQENGPPPVSPDCRYSVVCFSSQESPEMLCRRIAQSEQAFPETCFFNCVVMDNSVVVILGQPSPDFTEKKAEAFLTAQIEWLDRQDAPSVTAAFSAVHQGADQLERAYCEACLTASFSQTRPDAVITGFSNYEFKTANFLRDWHHLDKQLLFTKLIAENKLEEAGQLLNSLFPAEFLEEYFPESDITTLHLSSLKYQFLHCLDVMDSLDNVAWGGMLQELLYCKTHRQLYQLMQQLLSSHSHSASPSADHSETDRVTEIRSYIEAHYTDPLLNVSSIAEAFGMSANSLSQLFCRKAEGGVLDYIHQVRMEKAAELLRSGQNLTIQEIAMQTGYTSILTFNRKFKAAYGQTPSEYRRGPVPPMGKADTKT